MLRIRGVGGVDRERLLVVCIDHNMAHIIWIVKRSDGGFEANGRNPGGGGGCRWRMGRLVLDVGCGVFLNPPLAWKSL